MSPPWFLERLLGVRVKAPHHPNTSDGSSASSIAIAQGVLEALGLQDNRAAPESQSAGALMEHLIADDLRSELLAREPGATWLVDHGRAISDFHQYEHLAVLQAIIDDDQTGVLATAIGRDYEVKPDVTVGLQRDSWEPLRVMLHASVSCKLTLRSDRAQNVRQESAVLIRHRRGRLPHLVAVTAEPLPGRIAAIARGTGDVDAVYHLALPQLSDAVGGVGGAYQAEALAELTEQRRLLDYSSLAEVLATS